MLARRFTIVCLLAALFGMGFAILAADVGRQPRAYAHGTVVPCLFEAGQRCMAPRYR